MSKVILIYLSVLCSAIVVNNVSAADTVVRQKGKTFSEKRLIISSGEKITFLNDDTVSHNVYTVVGGRKQDLGLQKPGEDGELIFDAPGRYRVRCAVHPKMRINVIVE